MTGPRIGSLFSGYGGLDMGVQAALGGSTAWFVEYDKAPSKILAHHWPDVPNYGDITAVDWSQVEPVDILTGGSPCQDLSHAGKRQGMTEGTRSNLWVAMREAIAQLRPSLVVWENVRGAYSAEASSDLEHCPGCMGADRFGSGPVLRALGRVLGDLSDLGYDARWHGLRAADVGAPHGRFRVFVTAYPRSLRRGAWWPAVAGEAPRGGASADVAGRDLLPTPTSRDWKDGSPCENVPTNGLLGRAVWNLLPTPAVNDMGEGKTVEAWDEWTARMKTEHGNGNGHGKSLAIEAQRLTEARAEAAWREANWPTPEWGWDALPDDEKDAWRNEHGLPGRADDGLRAGNAVRGRLLPTPNAGDAKQGYVSAEDHAARAERKRADNPNLGDLQSDLPQVATTCQDWGIYADAIARWESLTRPAPPPTQPSKKGTPQLSPAFSEWLMGLPAGHVTGVPGLSRNDQLKALGNGVVPQQAAAALRHLLSYQEAS